MMFQVVIVMEHSGIVPVSLTDAGDLRGGVMLRALLNGLVGSVTLTVAHQLLKRFVTDAPKLDNLGMESIEKVYSAVGKEPPSDRVLFKNALLTDIIGNAIFYSQVGSRGGAGSIAKGVSLGLTMGAGASALPPLLGMSKDNSQKNMRQAAMTVGLYVLGGIAAACAAQCCSKSE